MRIKLRKTIQTIFIVSCFLLVNFILSGFVWTATHPDKSSSDVAAVFANLIHDKNDASDRVLDLRDDVRHDNFLSRKGIQRKVSSFLLKEKVATANGGLNDYLEVIPAKNNDRAKEDNHENITDVNNDIDNEVFINRNNIINSTSRSTPKSKTELRDIFISVKTTKKFHHKRLDVILDTWFIFARDNTYFFTDADDPELYKRTRGHAINTNCSDGHFRDSLCCKMSVEYDTYIDSGKRWFCHFDDDTYVNVPALTNLIQNYDHTSDVYLGRPSLNHPLQLKDPDDSTQSVSFWFATGGAGFCLSRALALKMMPYTGGGKLMSVCKKIRLPDDCSIGFIVYKYTGKSLTVNNQFHSHLEGLWAIKPKQLQDQLTFSYGLRSDKQNVVPVTTFPLEEDPTRFRSIHCRLYPYLKDCPTSDTR